MADRLYKLVTTGPLAGKGRSLYASEWKRIYGYDVQRPYPHATTRNFPVKFEPVDASEWKRIYGYDVQRPCPHATTRNFPVKFEPVEPEPDPPMARTYQGYLEIDHVRGVIYFHSAFGHTAVRIQNLPSPIPAIEGVPRLNDALLDIRHMEGTSWDE